MTVRRMGIACWTPKTTNTHSKYVILTVFHYKNGCINNVDIPLHVLCLCLVQVSTVSRSLWSLSAVSRCRLWVNLPQESVYVVETLQGRVSCRGPGYDSPPVVETV